jgi:hypothetical protein
MLMYKTDCYEMHACSEWGGGGGDCRGKKWHAQRLQSIGLEIFGNTNFWFSVVYESFIYIYKLY